jgi:hypothetical protein
MSYASVAPEPQRRASRASLVNKPVGAEDRRLSNASMVPPAETKPTPNNLVADAVALNLLESSRVALYSIGVCQIVVAVLCCLSASVISNVFAIVCGSVLVQNFRTKEKLKHFILQDHELGSYKTRKCCCSPKGVTALAAIIVLGGVLEIGGAAVALWQVATYEPRLFLFNIGTQPSYGDLGLDIGWRLASVSLALAAALPLFQIVLASLAMSTWDSFREVCAEFRESQHVAVQTFNIRKTMARHVTAVSAITRMRPTPSPAPEYGNRRASFNENPDAAVVRVLTESQLGLDGGNRALVSPSSSSYPMSSPPLAGGMRRSSVNRVNTSSRQGMDEYGVGQQPPNTMYKRRSEATMNAAQRSQMIDMTQPTRFAPDPVQAVMNSVDNHNSSFRQDDYHLRSPRFAAAEAAMGQRTRDDPSLMVRDEGQMHTVRSSHHMTGGQVDSRASTVYYDAPMTQQRSFVYPNPTTQDYTSSTSGSSNLSSGVNYNHSPSPSEQRNLPKKQSELRMGAASVSPRTAEQRGPGSLASPSRRAAPSFRADRGGQAGGYLRSNSFART